MPKETTNEEILQAINGFANHTEERFDKIEKDVTELKSDVTELKSDVTELKSDVTELKSDVTELKSDVTQIKSIMVTKDYLDDKLADLRGDLVVLMRKEDHKVAALVDILKQRKVLTDEDVKKIMSMEPFPQTT